MILIASAAYVNSEFQIEFGRLPPAFLPVGNRRLFHYQIHSLQQHFGGETIFLSLPSTFTPTVYDLNFLAEKGVRLIYNDETLTLAQSIKAVLDRIVGPGDSLRLLHGDTWLSHIPASPNCQAMGVTDQDYQWQVEHRELGSEEVWCGYFAFEHADDFRLSLHQTGDDFVAAVNDYGGKHPFDKPRADGWHDFGHVNTYFKSRTTLTTQRVFNQMTVQDGVLRKSGTPADKINAEALWFKNLPHPLRIYLPPLIQHDRDADGQPFYSLEYLPMPPLNEVYVFGKNPTFYWEKIFQHCQKYLKRCAEQPVPTEFLGRLQDDARQLVEDKTWQRLHRYIQSSGHPGLDVPQSINGHALPGLRIIVQDCLEHLNSVPPIPGVLHGDFCLSNILFDSRSDRIKLVDPRGMDAGGTPCLYGDLRYDLAKLAHSVIGLYDHIMAGSYRLHHTQSPSRCAYRLEIQTDERITLIMSMFMNIQFLDTVQTVSIIPLTVLLFLSMLPLHSDSPERQTALLANALRLYAQFPENGR